MATAAIPTARPRRRLPAGRGSCSRYRPPSGTCCSSSSRIGDIVYYSSATSRRSGPPRTAPSASTACRRTTTATRSATTLRVDVLGHPPGGADRDPAVPARRLPGGVLARHPREPRWRGLMLGLVIVPFWTSFLLRTFAWRIILSANGFLSNFLQDTGCSTNRCRSSTPGGRADRGRLQLPAADDLPAVRGAGPARPGAAGGEQGPRRRAHPDLHRGDAAAGHARHRAGLLLVFIPLMGEYVTPDLLGGAKGLMAGSLVVSQFLEAQNWASGRPWRSC